MTISTISARILVIDDDPDIRRLIRDLLEDASRARLAVDGADSAKEGLNKLSTDSYDIVFVDFKLPDMDGLELITEIKKRHFNLPVVVITSHGDKSLQIKALEGGAVVYLEKHVFNGETLEIACLYALAVSNKDASSAEKIVSRLELLLEESFKVIQENDKEMERLGDEFSILKQELLLEIKALGENMILQRKECKLDHDTLRSGIDSNSQKARYWLDWIVKNKMVSLIAFILVVLAFLLAMVIGAFIVDNLDVEKLKILKTESSYEGPVKWIS